MKSRGHRRHHASRCHSPKETTREAKRGDRPCDRPLLSLEARPGFEPRIKALQASALATWPSRPMKQAELVRPFFQMERATGFEPATSTLARWRATNCAKPANEQILYVTPSLDASMILKKLGCRGALVDDLPTMGHQDVWRQFPVASSRYPCRAQLPSSFSPPQTLCPSRADASGPTRPVMRGFPLWAGMGYALLALPARLVRRMESHAYQYPHALPSVPPCSCRPLSDTGLLAVARSR